MSAARLKQSAAPDRPTPAAADDDDIMSLPLLLLLPPTNSGAVKPSGGCMQKYQSIIVCLGYTGIHIRARAAAGAAAAVAHRDELATDNLSHRTCTPTLTYTYPPTETQVREYTEIAQSNPSTLHTTNLAVLLPGAGVCGGVLKAQLRGAAATKPIRTAAHKLKPCQLPATITSNNHRTWQGRVVVRCWV